MTIQDTEAATIAELGKQAATVDELQAGKIYGILNDQGGITITDTFRLAEHPQRKIYDAHVADVESFTAYLDKHGIPAETEILARHRLGFITATIDAGTATEPGWQDHLVQLELKKSKDWFTWAENSGVMFSQTEFAEFIEDNAHNIVTPASAEILEIASSLQIKRGVSFESATRLSTGEVQFGYREADSATAGKAGQLSIPESFTLALAPFIGGETYRVEATFRYRLRGQELTLGYKLQRADKILEDAFGSISDTVRTYANENDYLYLVN